MKKELFLQSLICLLAVSCSVREIDVKDAESNDGDVFYASLEAYSDSDTRVYVDEHIKILWDADDRITIFNENTMNQQYRFTGDTGDNSGFFKKVPSDDFATGNDMDFICAVYPYLDATSIDNSGVLTLTLPEVQSYREDSFGPGANTMVSSTEDNLLKFKNVGGYLVLKFYGEDVSVSSIMLEGHNGEKLSGTATVKPAVGVIPNITMASTAGTSITLTCDDPVELGTTREDASIFWMVVPPTAFTDGFKLTVTDPDGRVYVKETNADLSIVRNGVLRIAPIEVVLSEPIQPNNVIYYTSTDGSIVNINESAIDATVVSNEYLDGVGIITFDSPLTSIGRDAIVSLPLKTISLPPSVVNVSPRAFGCNTLQSFEGKYGEGRCLVISGEIVAFAPSGITKFTTPNGITSIGPYAFYGCTDLITLIISEGVERIGEHAFEFSGLKNLQLPETLHEVGYRFLAGTSVSSLSFPSNLQSISDINRYESLTALEINNPIPASISDNAFGISSTYPIYIPMGTLSSFSSAWPQYSERLREKTNSPLNELYYTTSDSKIVSLESGYTGMDSVWEQNDCIQSHTYGTIVFYAPITEIPHDSFLRSKLKSLSLPSSVTVLGGNCFDNCSDLESVNLPDGLEIISDCAFNECSSLSSISIPDEVSYIGSMSFYKCTSLTSITIPGSVTRIENSAFHSCSGLTSIVIDSSTPPAGGEGMFQGTNNCTIYVPSDAVNTYKTAQYWSDYADRIQAIPQPNNTIYYTSSDGFVVYPTYYYSSTTDGELFGANIVSNTYTNGKGIITFDNDVTKIGDYAFNNSSRLTGISLPESITSIGQEAFEGSALVSIRIPENVVNIYAGAFAICRSLSEFSGKYATEDGRCLVIDDRLCAFAANGITDYVIPSRVSTIVGFTFAYCTNLTSILLPPQLEIIEPYAFYNCPGISSISFPSTLCYIGNSSFWNCQGLKSITLPIRLNYIGEKAFASTGVSKVRIEATTPPSGGEGMFNSSCSIYVPSASVNAYQSTQYWRDYSVLDDTFWED